MSDYIDVKWEIIVRQLDGSEKIIPQITRVDLNPFWWCKTDAQVKWNIEDAIQLEFNRKIGWNYSDRSPSSIAEDALAKIKEMRESD